jgi:hypothetical protein
LFVVTPGLSFVLLVMGGSSYGQAIGDAALVTAAIAGPSAVVAVLIGPIVGALVPAGFFAWQWRSR